LILIQRTIIDMLIV